MRRGLCLRQDVADEALVRARAAREALHLRRLDQACRRRTVSRCAGNADFRRCLRDELDTAPVGKVNRVRGGIVEDVAALPDLRPLRAVALRDAHRPAEDDDAQLIVRLIDRHRFAFAEAMGGEADVAPPGGLRRNAHDVAAFRFRLHEQAFVIPPRLRLRRCAAPRGAIRVLGRPGDTHFNTPVDQFIVRPSRTSRDRYRYPMSAYSRAGATAGSCSASTTSHPRYEWRRRISISAAKSIAPSPGTVNAPLMTDSRKLQPRFRASLTTSGRTSLQWTWH